MTFNSRNGLIGQNTTTTIYLSFYVIEQSQTALSFSVI